LLGSYYGGIADELRQDTTRLNIQKEALQDSLKHVLSYTTGGTERGVYGRQAYPDTDSLRNAVSEEIRSSMLAERERLLAAVRLRWKARVDTLRGKLRADKETGSTLRFQLDETVGAYRVWGTLHVETKLAELGYDLHVQAQPGAFRIYAAEKNGRINIYADVDGEVTRLESFVRTPTTTAEVSPRWSIGVSALASPTVGLFGIDAGRYLTLFDGRLTGHVAGGIGKAGPIDNLQTVPYGTFTLRANF
jgi:hypothetical protein